MLSVLQRLLVAASPLSDLADLQRSRRACDLFLSLAMNATLRVLHAGARTCLNAEADASGDTGIRRDRVCDSGASNAGELTGTRVDYRTTSREKHEHGGCERKASSRAPYPAREKRRHELEQLLGG
jgi:hypothetical protein